MPIPNTRINERLKTKYAGYCKNEEDFSEDLKGERHFR